MMSSLSPFKQEFEEQSMCDKMEEFFSVFGKLKNHEGIVRLCENAVLPNVNDIAKLLTTANDLLQKHSACMFTQNLLIKIRLTGFFSRLPRCDNLDKFGKAEAEHFFPHAPQNGRGK